jgi:hypothetical protein
LSSTLQTARDGSAASASCRVAIRSAGEAGGAEAAAQVEPAQLGERRARHLEVLAARAVEPGVVADHSSPEPQRITSQLDAVGALAQRLLEGRHRVLRASALAPRGPSTSGAISDRVGYACSHGRT